MDNPVTTRSGYQRLEARLAHARSAYDKIVASNPEAAEAGDSSVWHDNFAYEENQRQMHQWARRVKELQHLLGNVRVVDPAERPQQVAIGCTVEVLDLRTRRTEAYEIAGFEDGDAARRRVAYNSPLGRALLGAVPGETREVHVAGGTRELEVLAIAAAKEER